MAKVYKINEIFYSLQGEGMFTGFPFVFIRFSGCNKKCSYCDTKHETYTLMTDEEIIKKITSLTSECNRVILTGGEPLLQVDRKLLLLLASNLFIIHIETNGTIIPEYCDLIDWITVSPKENDWILKEGDELKVVYEGQDLERYRVGGVVFDYFFLQPCSMKNIKECVEEVKKDPRWNFSLQQQKVLNIL